MPFSIPSPFAKKPVPPTFARASTAYDPYTGVLSASGVPRFPIVGGVQGVMVEEGTTNKALWSETFGNAVWAKTNTTVSSDTVAAPNGTITADTLIETVTGSFAHYITQSTILTTAQAGTVSCFAEPFSGNRRMWMGFEGGNYVVFDLSTGSGTLVGTGLTFGSYVAANGFRRYWVSSASVIGGGAFVGLADASGNVAYAGDGTSGIYIWGYQAQQTAYYTSYQQTTTTTATRAAETLTIPAAGSINLASGVVISTAYIDGDVLSATGATRMLFLHAITSGLPNRIGLYFSGANFSVQTINNAGTNTTVSSAKTSLTKGWHTIGARWSAAELSLWLDGVKLASSASPNLPSVLGTIYPGNDPGGTNNNCFGQPIASLDIFGVPLSDSEMAAYTSGNPIPLTDKHTLKMTCPGAFVLRGRAMSAADLVALNLI